MSPLPRVDESRAWMVWLVSWLFAVLVSVVALAVGTGWMRLAVLFAGIAAFVHSLWPSAALPDPARRTVLATSFVAHVVCLCLPPLLSDDLYRYLVDGQLVAQGYNPFAWAPASPKLDALAIAWRSEVNHPDLHTIYPPVAQAAFGLVCLVAAHPLIWKLAVVCGVWGTAFLWWRNGDRDASTRLVSHPLVILAAALDGHVDALGIPLMAALVATQGAVLWSGLVIGLGAGIKLFPLALTAVWLREGVRKTVVAGLVAGSVLAAGYLPMLNAGAKSFGSLGIYASTWEFNAGPSAVVGAALSSGLRWSGVPDPVEVTVLYTETGRRPAIRYFQGVATERVWWTHAQLGHRASRLVALALLLGVATAAWRGRWPMERAAAWVLTVVMVTSPTVHPWYLLWLVPVAVRPGAPLWLRWLCAVHVLGFWAPAQAADTEVWRDEVWIRGVCWGSWGLVCMASTCRWMLQQKRRTTHAET